MPRLSTRMRCRKLLFATYAIALTSGAFAAPTDLADAPIGATVITPANVILDVSVEFPTAISDAYFGKAYVADATTEFLGYFNPRECYSYHADATQSYFVPQSAASATHTCTGMWSGNFLNWALTQTIDPFRRALTGGFRIVDTASLTVLQKAFAANLGTKAGNFPDKVITGAALVSGATPLNWPKVTITNWNTGYNFLFSSGTPSTTAVLAYSGTGAPVSTLTYRATGAVQACATSLDQAQTFGAADPTKICRQYGINYKPIGVMQKYAAETPLQADSIRYAVFGYLNDSDEQRDGGVLRAKMKSVGPLAANPGQPPTSNAAAEWSASDGTFIVNPDTADAGATGVNNSGVMNYLNKFGLSGTYKTHDPVSELYYAATRYYRHLGNVPSYSDNADDTMIDGFPVITAWDDPIKFSCSKNYIIGIGDIHSWDDANVPGNTIRGAQEPAKPGAVTSDTAVDARTQTNFIANLEHLAGFTGAGVVGGTNPNNAKDYVVATGLGDKLMENIASPSGGWGASHDSFYMAGLAYDVHTRDIRPDITPKGAPITVSTFWLDVMEANDYHEKNQFWMTAKYGGFDTSNTSAFPGGYSQTGQTTPLPLATWNTGGYKDNRNNVLPDQYFQAGDPVAMTSGLNSAFSKIKANAPSGNSSSLVLISKNATTFGNANYAALFSNDWSGDLVGSQLTFNADGTVTSTVKWHARDRLPTQSPAAGITPLTATNRIIATSRAIAAGQGVAFRQAAISTAEAATLGANATAQTNMLNYLRGDQSGEGASGFRSRTYTLADITNSKPVAVGSPAQPYADSPLNPGYNAFVLANSARKTMVYVGANDGMMHAFDGSLTATTGGNELFAYVPSLLFNTNTDSAGNPVGLASLGVNPLQHHFLADDTPVITDVDFARTRASGPAPSPALASDWRSILVSGLGKGGKGYFALDVTDPSSITNEATLAGKVLWETSPAHMGYSYGQASVVKTAKYGWTIVLTSGYGNDDGRGYIFLVSPKNGSVYETISTGAGTPANPAGLAFVSAYVNDFSDFSSDALYAGDLLGNVWRVDLTGTGTLSAQKIATLADANGKPQPVTTRPLIETDPTSQARFVFIGTGRLLADTDLANADRQTFYAFLDGTHTAFDTSGVTLQRSDLVNDINPLVGVTLAGKKGFFVDLNVFPAGNGALASAERIDVQPTAANGVVAFAANLVGQDACGGGGSRVFALSFDSQFGIGSSQLVDIHHNPVVSITNTNPDPTKSAGVITDLSFVNVNGTLSLYSGDSSNLINNYKLNPNVGSTLKKLNWREAPSAQ